MTSEYINRVVLLNNLNISTTNSNNKVLELPIATKNPVSARLNFPNLANERYHISINIDINEALLGTTNLISQPDIVDIVSYNLNTNFSVVPASTDLVTPQSTSVEGPDLETPGGPNISIINILRDGNGLRFDVVPFNASGNYDGDLSRYLVIKISTVIKTINQQEIDMSGWSLIRI